MLLRRIRTRWTRSEIDSKELVEERGAGCARAEMPRDGPSCALRAIRLHFTSLSALNEHSTAPLDELMAAAANSQEEAAALRVQVQQLQVSRSKALGRFLLHATPAPTVPCLAPARLSIAAAGCARGVRAWQVGMHAYSVASSDHASNQ